MSDRMEQSKLLHALFERPGLELKNIKFCRGSGVNVTEEAFCAEVNKIIFVIDNGLTEPSECFKESSHSIDVKELAKRLA